MVAVAPGTPTLSAAIPSEDGIAGSSGDGTSPSSGDGTSPSISRGSTFDSSSETHGSVQEKPILSSQPLSRCNPAPLCPPNPSPLAVRIEYPGGGLFKTLVEGPHGFSAAVRGESGGGRLVAGGGWRTWSIIWATFLCPGETHFALSTPPPAVWRPFVLSAPCPLQSYALGSEAEGRGVAPFTALQQRRSRGAWHIGWCAPGKCAHTEGLHHVYRQALGGGQVLGAGRGECCGEDTRLHDEVPRDSAPLPDGGPSPNLQKRTSPDVEMEAQLRGAEMVRYPGILHATMERDTELVEVSQAHNIDQEGPRGGVVDAAGNAARLRQIVGRILGRT